MLETLMQRWQSLAVRERRLLVASVVVVALALVYLVSFEPAWLGRERLQRELPMLRSQLARVEQLADEARQLGETQTAEDNPQVVRARLERSIEGAGLRGALAQLQVSGSLFDVRFRGVPFARWLDWVDVTSRDLRLRVVDVAVTREAAPGMVTARVSLEMPRGQGR